MQDPLTDEQLNEIKDQIKEGVRVSCRDGSCIGIYGKNLECNDCGKNIVTQNEVDKMRLILSIAEKRGQNVEELLDSLDFHENVKNVLKNLAEDLRIIKFVEEMARNHEKDKKRLNDHVGYKRLSFFIPFVVLITSYIAMILNDRVVSKDEAFVYYPIISLSISLFIYMFTRIFYWVIDGFKN